MLDLADRLGIALTCFTTGDFAEHCPEDMARVAERHEVASHGFYHSSFENDDLKKSKDTLERISGQSVTSFRRARFAPTDERAIRDAGYTVNSSSNPIWLPGRYNNLRALRLPHESADAPGLLNMPISASPVLRVPLFWLAIKNLPMPLIRSASRRCLERDGYLNIFFHPWEFCDLGGFGLPSIVTRRQGQAMLDRLEGYLEWLRPRGEFVTFRGYAGEWDPKRTHRGGAEDVETDRSSC